MSVLGVFAVLDRAAQVYGRPFCAPNLAMAKRMFFEAVRDQNPDNALAKYPADFALFCVGEYDEESADLVSLDHPQPAAEARDAWPASPGAQQPGQD